MPGYGSVTLGQRAVKNSRSHGLSRPRIAAFVIVPDVLQSGRLIDVSPLRDAASGELLTFAAPARGKDVVAAVQVKRDPNTQRMWAHQVVLKERLRDGFKSGPGLVPKQRSVTGNRRGALETILRDIYAVKPDAISKVVDANGEPLVVYHGSPDARGIFGDNAGFSTAAERYFGSDQDRG